MSRFSAERLSTEGCLTREFRVRKPQAIGKRIEMGRKATARSRKAQSILVEALEERQFLSVVHPAVKKPTKPPVVVGFSGKAAPRTQTLIEKDPVGNGKYFELIKKPTRLVTSLPPLQVGAGDSTGTTSTTTSGSSGSIGLTAPTGAQVGGVGQFHINLIEGPSIQLPQNIAARKAFEAAAAFLESQFTDPITINIDAEFAPIGDTNILGETAPTNVTLSASAYEDVYDRLQADASSAEGIVAQLPTKQQFKALLPPPDANGAFSINGLAVPTANLMALGVPATDPSVALSRIPSQFKPGVGVDAQITFNSLDAAAFDFDPSDGITPSQEDFTLVCVHEMIHALGFDSAVDDADIALVDPAFSRIIQPTVLDLFRMKPEDGATNFTQGPRVLSPGLFVPNQVLVTGNSFDPTLYNYGTTTLGEIPMSTGAFTGDGEQASHWFDDENPPFITIGIMDPTASSPNLVVSPGFTANDLRALDLIGYDSVPTAAGIYRFSQPSYTFQQDQGTATITVTRTGGSVGLQMLNYTTQDLDPNLNPNAATAGVDYTPVSGTLSFADGQTSATIQIPLLDNGAASADKVFNVVISPEAGSDPIIGNAPTGSLAVPVTIRSSNTSFVFKSSVFSATELSGAATITIDRVGNADTAQTVSFSTTTGGSATVGLDYSPVSGVLTFAPGETEKTFTVPIVNDHIPDEGTETVALTLLGPDGLPAAATLDILDTSAPQVKEVRLNPNTKGALMSITFVFTEPLAAPPPLSAVKVFEKTETQFGTGSRKLIALTGTSGNPNNTSFTVMAAKPLKAGTTYQLNIASNASVADNFGNELDGNADGIPGDKFVGLVSRGTKLTYFDENANKVTLSLTGPGAINLFRRSDQSAEILRISGAKPGVTVLTGTISPSDHQTVIDQILGSTGVTINLPLAEFKINDID
jgi:hypothetical protein